MRALVAFNLWQWIDENRATFEPPVGNKVIWEDSQFTAMVVRGPNARRDFHVDPSDEIFYMLRGAMRLEYMVEGRRHEQIIREGELACCPRSSRTRPTARPTPGVWWSRSSAGRSRPSPSSGTAIGAIGCSTR